MAIQLPVYVIGFGDLYREFFNAIAATVGSPDYGKLIKLMVLLGGCWTLVIASVKRNHALNIRWILTYVVLTSVVLIPNATVIIKDRTADKYYSVSNIPLGLAILANMTTSIGTGFTELVESVFHTPNDLSYTQSGLLMGSKIIGAASHFQVVGGNFQKNLQGFVHQCVFYDVLLHKYSLQDLVNSPNLWTFVASHASPARAFVYNGKVVTCQQGVQMLSKDWQTAIQNSTNAYANILFVNNQNAKAQLLSYLGTSYQYLANLSDDASTLMQQNMMIQAIQDGIGEWASGINAQTALEDFAFAKAQQQKRIGYHILYRLAVYWLPLSKTVMELILLGSFLIIVLFVFFPFGTSIVKNYVMTFIWLQLWPPLFAFENFILTLYGSHLLGSSTLLPGGSHGLTLSTYSALNQMNSDLGTLAGFFAALTPLLAVGIFKGMMSVFSQAANYIGGAIQSFAFSAAGEAVTGNLSLGNTQFSNHSAYNTSAYHFDTNPRVASGMMTYQLTGGGTASVAPDGETILNSQSAISQLPVTPHMAQSMQLTFSRMADRAESTALRDVNSAQTSYTTGLRDLYELGSTQSHTSASGMSSSVSTSGSFSNAAREAHQLIDRFAKENNISHTHASQLLGAVYGNANIHGSFESKREIFGKIASWATGVNVGASASAGIKGEMSSSSTHNESTLLNKAESFSREHNFGQTIEHAMRAVHENNFRTGSESSDRLAKSMASSFEQGNRFSHDAANSFEQSQSYRQQSSLVEHQSIGINAQATQEFVHWLQQQPSIQHHGGGMTSQDIMTMMQDNLPLAEQYAQQFVQEKERQYVSSFESKYSESQVSSTYHENNRNIAGSDSIRQQHQDNNQTISQSATKIDTGNVTDAVNLAADATIDVANKESSDHVSARASTLKEVVSDEISRKGIKDVD